MTREEAIKLLDCARDILPNKAIDMAIEALQREEAEEKGYCHRIKPKEYPSADAVEVVRCGECKHMIADGRCMEFADDGIRPSASDFCSYGERKRR